MRVRHSVYLVLAAFFWGTTFVAQSVAMDRVEPFTYNMCRDFIGALFLLPLAIRTGRIDPLAVNYRGEAIPGITAPAEERRKNLIRGGLIVGLCMFAAGGFQQVSSYRAVNTAGHPDYYFSHSFTNPLFRLPAAFKEQLFLSFPINSGWLSVSVPALLEARCGGRLH